MLLTRRRPKVCDAVVPSHHRYWGYNELDLMYYLRGSYHGVLIAMLILVVVAGIMDTFFGKVRWPAWWHASNICGPLPLTRTRARAHTHSCNATNTTKPAQPCRAMPPRCGLGVP